MSDLALQRLSARPDSMSPALALRDLYGMTKRNLLRIIRTPQLLVLSVVQPTIILLLFRYVLGGAIHIPGLNYVNYVVPSIFLEAVLIGGMTTALALAQDLQAGMIDRFRSLPMARSAFLAGRTLADLCRSTVALCFMIGLGLLVGFRFHSSVAACVGGIGLIILFGYALSGSTPPSGWPFEILRRHRSQPSSRCSSCSSPVRPSFLWGPCRVGCNLSHATNPPVW